MKPWKKLILALVVGLVIVAVGGHFWYWGLPGKETPGDAKPESKADPEEDDHIHISPQAAANLGLKVQKILLNKTPYWRTIQVPGVLVDRPGCDRLVTAPLPGIVKQLASSRGDLVRPGETLVTIELIGEQLLTTQAELYKSQRELLIIKEEQRRLAEAVKSGAIPQSRMIELTNQEKRLQASLEALQHELGVRGLTESHIAAISQGHFLKQITVPVPHFPEEPKGPFLPVNGKDTLASDPRITGRNHDVYQVESLKVLLGEHVQAGQALVQLADHQRLFIEGRVFESEAPWIQKAARLALPVKPEFVREADHHWPAWDKSLTIAFLSNRVDPAHQTLSFFLPLYNEYHEYAQNGRTYRLWRFRPGQRVLLRVPVEAYQDVYVLPADAIVREGAEAYVFRQVYDAFERKAVHVLFQDRQTAILGKSSDITPGDRLAFSAAAQLNWALQARSQGQGHEHDHDH